MYKDTFYYPYVVLKEHQKNVRLEYTPNVEVFIVQ